MPGDNMDGKSEGSSRGTPSKRSDTRDKDTLARQLANALGTNDTVQRKSDLQFIRDRLEGPDADMTHYIAALLRQGSLREALIHKDDTRAGDYGKQMPPSMLHYRSLREAQLYLLLNKFEPTIFKQLVLDKINRETLIQMVSFALNVKKGDKLPACHDLLRFGHTLAAFCNVRYMKLGRRLKSWKPNAPASWGHFRVTGQSVSLMTPGDCDTGRSVEIKQIATASDWVICDKFCSGAYLWSAEEDTKIPLRSRFSKQGVKLPAPESINWEIPISEWPDAMRPQQSLVDDSDVVVPKRKRPKGTGAAAGSS